MKNRITFLGICLLCWIAGVHAQNNTMAGGGHASGTGGTVSYSIGEVGYAAMTGTSGSVQAGCQQPFEIITSTGAGIGSIDLYASMYPNPSTGSVTLKVDRTKIGDVSYQLYDMQGKLITGGKAESDETFICMDGFASATYFVKVFNNENEIKSFKIIKK